MARFCHLLLIMLMTRYGWSSPPGRGEWKAYLNALQKLDGLSKLVIFHQFPYEEEFHRRFPNQLVMMSTRRTLCPCPQRILVISGLQKVDFYQSFFMRMFGY